MDEPDLEVLLVDRSRVTSEVDSIAGRSCKDKGTKVDVGIKLVVHIRIRKGTQSSDICQCRVVVLTIEY